MHKGKNFLILIATSLLIGLALLPAGITRAENAAQSGLQVNPRVFLPVVLNQKSNAPTAIVPQRTQNVPTKKAPTATRTPTRAATATRAPTNPAPTATRAATNPAPTATATRAAPTATSVPPSGSFTFLSWADTKSGTSALAALSNQARKLNPAFSLYEGDLQNAGFDASTISTWVNAVNGNSSNGMYDTLFPLRGNHDVSNTSGWQSYFNTPGTATRVGATQFSTQSADLTYAFDYGNAYFIGIDVPGDVTGITAAQITYLDSGLAGAEARGLTHAFVFFHGPIYPVSSHTSCTTRVCATPSSVANLINVLNKHSIVSAVFNGHEHLQAYVHMDSSRVPEITHPFEQFITGSAGASLYPCDKTYRFDMCGSYNGFATVTVSGRSFTVSVYQQGAASPVKTYAFTKP